MDVFEQSAQSAMLPVLAVKGGHPSIGKGGFGKTEAAFCAIGLSQSELTTLTVAHFLFGCAESNIAVSGFHNVWSMVL